MNALDYLRLGQAEQIVQALQIPRPGFEPLASVRRLIKLTLLDATMPNAKEQELTLP